MTEDSPRPASAIDRGDATWRELCKLFRKVNFANLSLEQVKATFKAYGPAADDHITLNLETSVWRKALSLLEKLDQPTLEYVSKLAKVNIDLLEPHVKRKAALYFGVYPALLAGASKFLGIETNDLIGIYLSVLGVGALMFLNFYTARWQAGELDSCIQFALARRSLHMATPKVDVPQ